jgi:hypothetical protein
MARLPGSRPIVLRFRPDRARDTLARTDDDDFSGYCGSL